MNGRFYNHAASTFENNIFLLSAAGCSDYFFNAVSGCVLNNNIISFGNGGCGMFFFGNSNGNIFNNNLFRLAQNACFPKGSNLQYNNVFGFVDTDVFNGGTGYVFSYNEDYHMLPACIAHNAGTDEHRPGYLWHF